MSSFGYTTPQSRDARQVSLAESMNASTRSLHAQLNKLILARLPLALPPHARDPSFYVSGLLHIAPIYITFESLWHDIIKPSSQGVDNDESQTTTTSSAFQTSPAESQTHDADSKERIRSLLTDLYLPSLMRSGRLRSDIRSMTKRAASAVDDQLRLLSEGGHLGHFVDHIRSAVEHRPHVLLAYAYILYMALFAGGRFIRASLESVASRGSFWENPVVLEKPCQRSPTPSASPATAHLSDTLVSSATLPGRDEPSPDNPRRDTDEPIPPLPLSFFHFETPQDGEDLKLEFKTRLTAAEDLLTSHERHDIVQEAMCIFENMLCLVAQIDGICETSLRADVDGGTSLASSPFTTFAARPRDSVVVARERREAGKGTSYEEAQPADLAKQPESKGRFRWCRSHLGQRKRNGDRNVSEENAEHNSRSTTSLEDNDDVILDSKSVRFESNRTASTRRQRRQMLSFLTDGAASRRGSSETNPPNSDDGDKGEIQRRRFSNDHQRGIFSARGMFLPKVILVAAIAALVGAFFFPKSP